MFGFGPPVELRKKSRSSSDSSKPELHVLIKSPDFLASLKHFNDYHELRRTKIHTKQVDDHLVLEGLLRVHWGVKSPIKLKEGDEVPTTYSRTPKTPKSWRRSYSMAIHNGLGDDLAKKLDLEESPARLRRASLEDITEVICTDAGDDSPEKSPKRTTNLHRYHTVSYKGEERRKSSINGHVFNLDTSIFTPTHGSVTTVQVSSQNTTPEVIQALLDKFKVENDPKEFCLCTIKKNGEVKLLEQDDYPLVQRVLLGPIDDEAQIYIQEKKSVHTVSQEVAQFISLPDRVLQGFLQKFDDEEAAAIERIRNKYTRLKEAIIQRLEQIEEVNVTRM